MNLVDIFVFPHSFRNKFVEAHENILLAMGFTARKPGLEAFSEIIESTSFLS